MARVVYGSIIVALLIAGCARAPAPVTDAPPVSVGHPEGPTALTMRDVDKIVFKSAPDPTLPTVSKRQLELDLFLERMRAGNKIKDYSLDYTFNGRRSFNHDPTSFPTTITITHGTMVITGPAPAATPTQPATQTQPATTTAPR